jgi:hypothetical protein
MTLNYYAFQSYHAWSILNYYAFQSYHVRAILNYYAFQSYHVWAILHNNLKWPKHYSQILRKLPMPK